MIFLGIDTSNYTTSAALYFKEGNRVISKTRLLPVHEGEIGLRQSEALFHHIKQLPEIIDEIFSETGDLEGKISAVAFSAKPRDIEGSYMPCFLAGSCVGKCLSSALKVPRLAFSHQQGHIAAALYGIDRLDLLNSKFFCWHLSGGTTELLSVHGGNGIFKTELIFKTLDISAGQLIDRVGVMLGYPFPAGKYVDKAAARCEGRTNPAASVKESGFNLSGCENTALKMIKSGADESLTARYTIDFISKSVESAMSRFEKGIPILFAGGVSCSSVFRDSMTAILGADALFAPPHLSSDNAVGTAILASLFKEGIDA